MHHNCTLATNTSNSNHMRASNALTVLHTYPSNRQSVSGNMNADLDLVCFFFRPTEVAHMGYTYCQLPLTFSLNFLFVIHSLHCENELSPVKSFRLIRLNQLIDIPTYKALRRLSHMPMAPCNILRVYRFHWDIFFFLLFGFSRISTGIAVVQ